MATIFTAHIIPRSSINKIIGFKNGSLKIKITTPPIDGAANKAIINIISKEFNIAKQHVSIVRGFTSRHKTIEISDPNFIFPDTYDTK